MNNVMPHYTPMEILEKALAKENEAFEMYSLLLNHSSVPMVQELLALLKDEEHKHIKLVESRIAQLLKG